MRKYWHTTNKYLWDANILDVGDSIFYDLSDCPSIGDTLCSTPTIKKVSEAYGCKLNIISKHPEIFKNNPYIDKNYPAGGMNMDYIKENFIVHNSFYDIGKQNDKGIQHKHAHTDIRQYHSMLLGFQLFPEEMECIYNPDEFTPIDGLPEKYVLIHPVQNWPSRTWDSYQWVKLTEELNKSGISVVSIGKDSSEVGFWNIDKPVFNFHIENGLNLMNETNLSQAWHLIQNSIAFVTMDSGLLHLAGTTDAHIIQLGSSINPRWRAPYRHNSQEYKYHYVGGGCSIFCASDMKYGVGEWGSVQGVPPLINCLEKKPTFECHPQYDSVFNKIIEIYEE
jgi:ADP-heptose:LPS heptosyltransferase